MQQQTARQGDADTLDGKFTSWAKASDKDVPNIHLLYALLDFIRNHQGPAPFFKEKRS